MRLPLFTSLVAALFYCTCGFRVAHHVQNIIALDLSGKADTDAKETHNQTNRVGKGRPRGKGRLRGTRVRKRNGQRARKGGYRKGKARPQKHAKSKEKESAIKVPPQGIEGKIGQGNGQVVSAKNVHFIEQDMTIATLKALRKQGACIVVSANTGLLTKGATGIAGKVEAVGGRQLLEASNREKKRWGGKVPVGKAAWAVGGGFKGVAFAVTMEYKAGQRVLATPETVRRSFANALRISNKHSCNLVATTVLSARSGYHNLPEDKARKGMATAMLRAVDDAKKDGVRLDSVRIYAG